MQLMSRSTGHIKTRDNKKINNADAGSGMGRFGRATRTDHQPVRSSGSQPFLQLLQRRSPDRWAAPLSSPPEVWAASTVLNSDLLTCPS